MNSKFLKIKKMAASARGNGIEDKREIGEIFRGYRNSQCDYMKELFY
jgi:hypothetical protein